MKCQRRKDIEQSVVVVEMKGTTRLLGMSGKWSVFEFFVENICCYLATIMQSKHEQGP
jgi:hypothetical protein